MDYRVLAFYLIRSIEAPRKEVERFKEFFHAHDIRSRVYINEEGINAQLSIAERDTRAFFDWYFGDGQFKGTDIKVHSHHEHVFPKKSVKYRKQLVALDQKVDYSKRGELLSAQKWKQILDERDQNTLILDVRNDYEWEIGHFEGAKKSNCQTFREFPQSVKKLKETYDCKKTRILVYCTGGIRCESYSCLIREEGYEEVYQLEGGVIKYGQEIGSAHWKGNLFVFDDRVVIPICDEKNEVIGKCRHCDETIDSCYNCANMDCNELFLSCMSCCSQFLGCCCSNCMGAPRRREFSAQESPKPYRRLSHAAKLKYRQRDRGV